MAEMGRFTLCHKTNKVEKMISNKFFRRSLVEVMAFMPTLIGLSFAMVCILIWILGVELESENLTTMEIGIWFLTAIIQGVLLYGLIKEISGILTSWLFVSFILIIGLAVNFGYVSWFFDSIFYCIIYEFRFKYLAVLKCAD